MKILKVKAQSGHSSVYFDGSLDQLQMLTAGRRTVVITDTNVGAIYGNRFSDFDIITLGTGEGIKNLSTVQYIYEQFLELGLNRDAFIVGIGGGVVCDITGFAAATFLRGLDFGFFATTVLSQVDASVGGKNGVNLNSYKNLVGTFCQPNFVVLDHNVLSSLDQREVKSGLAEVVKAAAIRDFALFERLEKNVDGLLALDRDAIGDAIYSSVKVKADVVQADEKESSVRRLLNFGHTFGHAVELNSDLTHGEAVSVGMVVAANISVSLGLLKQEAADRLEKLLQRCGLPTRKGFDAQSAVDALGRDKKREGNNIHFVLLNGLGDALVRPISIQELTKVLNDLRLS